jgi:hypothetical protein
MRQRATQGLSASRSSTCTCSEKRRSALAVGRRARHASVMTAHLRHAYLQSLQLSVGSGAWPSRCRLRARRRSWSCRQDSSRPRRISCTRVLSTQGSGPSGIEPCDACKSSIRARKEAASSRGKACQVKGLAPGLTLGSYRLATQPPVAPPLLIERDQVEVAMAGGLAMYGRSVTAEDHGYVKADCLCCPRRCALGVCGTASQPTSNTGGQVPNNSSTRLTAGSDVPHTASCSSPSDIMVWSLAKAPSAGCTCTNQESLPMIMVHLISYGAYPRGAPRPS